MKLAKNLPRCMFRRGITYIARKGHDVLGVDLSALNGGSTNVDETNIIWLNALAKTVFYAKNTQK